MRMSDYGIWVLGEDYESLKTKPEIIEPRWYPEGDPRLVPSAQQIAEHSLHHVHFYYHVHGVEQAGFRLLIDEQDPTEPFELDIFDRSNPRYIACCLVTRANLWEKMASAKHPARLVQDP